MSRQKVLFLAESLSVGGAEKALVSILKSLDSSKFDVSLMLISKSGDFVKDAERIEGLRVRNIVKPTSNPILSFINSIKVKTIYQWLPASVVGNYLCNSYDVVVAFCEGYLTKWVGASTVSCRKIAWVHTDMVQNDWPLKTGVFRNLEEEMRAYHNFDEIIAVSKTVAEGMEEIFGCHHLSVIYNIIDSDIIRKSKSFIPEVRRARLNIVSVGRLEYVKGYDQLVDAMDILVNKQCLDIHLCLVGDGSQRADIEQKISNARLQDNVYLAGLQPNPYPYVAAADLFVCSSKQEGFNIAILEAMTLGKPVAATASAGPLEILDEGKFGLILENNAQGLAEGISQIYNNPAEVSRLSKLSVERSKYYSAGMQLASLYKIIER